MPTAATTNVVPVPRRQRSRSTAKTRSLPIAAPILFCPPTHNPHVGFEGTDSVREPPIQLLGEYWGNSDGSPDQQPVLGINCTGGSPNFLIFFLDVTVGTETTGEWNECSGSGVTLSNPTAFDELLSNAGFYLSDSSIPLDALNFGDFPPPANQAADLPIYPVSTGVSCPPAPASAWASRSPLRSQSLPPAWPGCLLALERRGGCAAHGWIGGCRIHLCSSPERRRGSV